MVAFVRFFIVFSSLTLIITNGDERPCTFFRPLGILDCVDQGLRHVPILQDGRRDVKVLDLRQNNISTVGNTVLTIYPNLKIVDLRHNPNVCGRINLVGVTIISDCPILTTSLKPSPSPIQNTPQSSPSKAPPISIITSCLAPKSSFPKATILTILSHSSIKNIPRLSTIPAPRSSTAKVLSTPLTLATRSSPVISTPRLSTVKPLGTPPTPTSLYTSLTSTVTTKTYSKPIHNSVLPPIPSTLATSTRFYNKPTVSLARSQPRSYDLLIYLSISISTILVLMVCVKFKLYTRCRQNSHEIEQNETVHMSPTVTSMSSSGSSTDIYLTTSV